MESGGTIAVLPEQLDLMTVVKAGPEFRVWSGNDEDTLPILAIGGYGVVSVASHLVGEQLQRMITSFLQKDTEAAAEIHRRLVRAHAR